MSALYVLSSGYLTSTLLEAQGIQGVLDSDFVKEYESIFIKVKKWGAFESDDIERNRVYKCDDETLIPNFVSKYERELDSKPGLTLDVCYFFDYSFDADWPM